MLALDAFEVTERALLKDLDDVSVAGYYLHKAIEHDGVMT